MDEKLELKIQSITKDIIPKIDSHNKYFEFLNLKIKSPKEINEML